MDLFEIRKQLNEGKNIFEIPLRVTYYARVSTEKDEQINSLSNQVKYYSDFIKSNSKWTYVEGFVDEGLSGTSVKKREAFLKMIEDAKLNKFDFIITKEISRFSRNTLDSIKYTQELLEAGVGVLFQSDNINTLHTDSELRLTIMSSIAQDEVRRISERVKFGFKRAIENGVVLGSNRFYGYEKDKGKLVIVEKEAEMIRKIYDLYANENKGFRSIAVWLADNGYFNAKGNEYSATTIKNIIRNPKYKGYYCGGKTQKIDYRTDGTRFLDSNEWIMYEDNESVPPIVSEEIWGKANRILENRVWKMANKGTSYQNKYVYSGKIICMEHNTPYHHGYHKGKYGIKEVWNCRKYRDESRKKCLSPTLYTKELDDIMRQIIQSIVQNKENIIKDLINIYATINKNSSIKEDVAKLKVEIKNIKNKKDKLLELSLNGNLSNEEFEERNTGFNDEIAILKERIADLEDEISKNDEISRDIEVLRKVIAEELSFESAMSEGIVATLIDRIEVYRTDDKNIVKLKIYLKIIDTSLDYQVNKKRNKDSVLTCLCNNPYLYSQRPSAYLGLLTSYPQ